MPLMMPGSTILTMGMCLGMAEKSTWSTPAPDEKKAFSRGRLDKLRRCLPGNQVFDLVEVAGIGPHAKVQIGSMFGEVTRPGCSACRV